MNAAAQWLKARRRLVRLIRRGAPRPQIEDAAWRLIGCGLAMDRTKAGMMARMDLAGTKPGRVRDVDADVLRLWLDRRPENLVAAQQLVAGLLSRL